MSNRSIVAEPGQHSIVATCTFNAPRELVFKLMTDPAAITQWWGPRGLTTTVDIMEPQDGGRWRYVVSNAKGKEWCFHGVYHTVAAPDRLVFTHEYEAEPDHVSLETTVFEDYDGGTKITTTSIFQSIADRDAMVASDMQDGEEESMDRLAELLVQQLAAVR